MPSQLTDANWTSLLRRIRDGNCTPFLGAGASFPNMPLGSEVAQAWAKQYEYPLGDTSDLARVAEFLAIKNDPMFPKEEFVEQYLRDVTPPDFGDPNEVHGLLADLPIPIYMTTNYDDFLMRALESRGRTPHRELCAWNDSIRNYHSVFDDTSGFEPKAESPVVFHLHGHGQELASLVLTESDYLSFLVHLGRVDLLPPEIQRVLAETSLLFIGYSLQDWSFRVVFQGVMGLIESNLRRMSVTVQLPPAAPGQQEAAQQEEMQKYLSRYYESMDIRVYWGTAADFAAELRKRWQEFSGG